MAMHAKLISIHKTTFSCSCINLKQLHTAYSTPSLPPSQHTFFYPFMRSIFRMHGIVSMLCVEISKLGGMSLPVSIDRLNALHACT